MQGEKEWNKQTRIEQNIQELWGNIKRYNTYIINIPEWEEMENAAKEIFEIMMAKKFQKLRTDNKTQIQEA